MVEMNVVSDMVMNVFTFIISFAVLAGVVIGGYFGFKYWKRWAQFEVRVWGEDGFGQIQETIDKGGIFVDSKTKNKRFWLKNGNVGLNPDDVPVLRVGNKKIVYVRRYGLKNFRFMYPEAKGNVSKIDLEKINEIEKNIESLNEVKYEFFKPTVKDDQDEMIVGDEDVNWAINAYDREKKKFISQTLLQYMPFIIIGFVSICILIMIIWVLKQFDVLKDVALALQAAAGSLSGGNIIK